MNCWIRIKLHLFIYLFFSRTPWEVLPQLFLSPERWYRLVLVAIRSVSPSRQPDSHQFPWADPRFPENLPPAQHFLEEQELLPNASSACCSVSRGSHCPHRSAEIWVLPNSRCGLIAFLLSIIQISVLLLRCWCELSAYFPVVTLFSLFVGKKITVYRKCHISLAGSLTHKWMSLYIQIYFMI